jgi:hypothetical protein
VACIDYVGSLWYPYLISDQTFSGPVESYQDLASRTKTSEWCHHDGYTMYPTQVILDGQCTTTTTEPEPQTSALKSVMIEHPAVITSAGSKVIVSWKYSGFKTNTVSLYLITSGMSAQNLSPYLVHNKHNTSQNPPFDTLASSLSGSPIYLDAFNAVDQIATVVIPAAVLPTFNADILVVLNQNIRIYSYYSQHESFEYLYAISESALCNGVVCADPNAVCDPLNGLCACPSGMIMPADAVDTTKSICQLPCEGLCLNGSSCILDQSSPDAFCQCFGGFSGEFCEYYEGCEEQNKECNGHGYLPVFKDRNSVICLNTCVCTGYWESGDDLGQDQCNSCSLTPTCHQTGTDLIFTDLNCQKCACRIGYGGDICQYRTLIGTLNFKKTEVVKIKQGQNGFEVANFGTLTHSFETAALDTTPIFNSQQITLPFTTQKQLELNLALSLGLPPSSVSTLRTVETTQLTPITPTTGSLLTTTSVSFQITSSTSATPGSTINPSGDGNNSLENLYNAWGQLQDDYQNRPISNTSDLGTVTKPEAAYDPNCTSNDVTEGVSQCPDGKDPYLPIEKPIIVPPTTDTNQSKKSSLVSTIIAVIVCVVVCCFVIIGLVCLHHARVKQKWCFVPKPDKNGSSGRGSKRDTASTARGTVGSAEDVDVDIDLTSQSDVTKASKKSYDYGGIQQGPDHVITRHRQRSASSNGSVSSLNKTTIDLEPIDDDEARTLPSGWSKWKHTGTGEIFYTNDVELKSQRFPPGGASNLRGKWF